MEPLRSATSLAGCLALALSIAPAAGAAGCTSSQTRRPREAVASPASPTTRGIRCGTAWDPSRGAIPDARVVFEGDRVAALGPAAVTPAPAEELDLRPLFCMPGLVDAHTHLTSYARESASDSLARRREQAVRNARLTLEAGVTTVRDLGGEEGVDLWLRNRIASGTVPGPRMLCAGSQIGVEGSVGGPDAAKAEVDAHASAGFDVIKLFATGGANDPVPLMTGPEISAAASEAHARGLRVAVHAITGDGIERSIAAHVDSIEHAQELTVERARVMAQDGITLVPTLYILRYYVEDAEHLGFDARHVADLRRMIDTLIVPFEARFPSLLATGVKVAMGSDAFMALHGKNAHELAYMVRAGMAPEQALRAATSTSADLLGWRGKVGTLAPGAFADVVAMAGDPRQDVGALEHPAVVVAGGRVVRDSRRERSAALAR